MNIIKGILWGLVAQIITFLQLQGQLKYDFLKNNVWLSLLMGMPISYGFMQSVKYFVAAYDGEIYPSRLLGFSIGIVVFILGATFLFKEPITLKTFICLILAVAIVLVQTFMK